MSHSHGHDCHGESHDHDHEHDHSDDITPALQQSLYPHIDFDSIVTLNESVSGSGKAVVKKEWAQRLEPEPEIESDTDEQLLMTIPFTGQVKLHSILIRTSESPSAPRTLKLFINKDDMDFSAAEDAHPVQELELSSTGIVQEIPVKRALFARVRSLTLFFADNHGYGDEDVTRISYLGFRGDWMQLGRAPERIIYEAAANPNDHELTHTAMDRVEDGINRKR